MAAEDAGFALRRLREILVVAPENRVGRHLPEKEINPKVRREKIQMKSVASLFWLFFATATAMVGHHIHGSFFWTVVDFFLSPLAWVKWFICQEVSLAIIRSTFAFFLK